MTTSQPEDCTITVLCDELLLMITDLMSNHHTWEQLAVKTELINFTIDHIHIHFRYDPQVTQEEKLYFENTVSPRVKECTALLKNALARLDAASFN